jgi:hypothetical protein
LTPIDLGPDAGDAGGVSGEAGLAG